MKVAWVCYYPGSVFADRAKIRDEPMFHPVPWITAQAPVIANTPGIELHIVTVKKNCLSDDHFERDNIHFHFLKIPPLPRGLLLYQDDLLRIRGCLRSIGPDLVHGFGTESSYGYSAVKSGYPALIKIQGIVTEIASTRGKRRRYLNPRLLISSWLEQQTIRRCQNFVCDNSFAANYVRRRNPRARVYQIGNLVRREFYNVQPAPGCAAGAELLFVGSVIPEKGIEILVSALKRLQPAYPNVTLHVAGVYEQGYFLRVLRPLVLALGLQDRVVFHGYCPVDKLLPLFARVNLIVLPTLMDTSPNVLAEALVSGIPVVASAVGGIPEMLCEGSSGILVQPGSAESLADGIAQALADPTQAAARACLAREKARRQYSVESQASRLVDVYRQIVT